jgi:hypothetical protein
MAERGLVVSLAHVRRAGWNLAHTSRCRLGVKLLRCKLRIGKSEVEEELGRGAMGRAPGEETSEKTAV